MARAFLWYKGKSRPISGRLTSQLNGFFNYADVRDPTTPDYPVSKLFLRGLNYSISAVEGEQPVLRIGSFCSKAFEELSLGNLKDSAPTGNTPPEAKKVDLSPLESIPHPVPKMCYPDLALQDFDDNGNAYRIALRAQAKVMGEHGFSVPEPFHSLGAAKKNRPLTYNYFNTYLSNDTSQFLTIAFQEPVVMFAEGLHTHLVGVARMERVDDSGQYSVYTLPFTLVYLRGYMIRPHVAAYRDDKFGIMLYVRADYAFRKTKCFCGMEGEAIPACTKDDCSEEWKTATPIYLQKVAGVKPMRDCCSTENCLNPNFDWETCRL